MAEKRKAGKKPQERIWIGPGRFNFPYLSQPDTGREYSDGAFKTDLLITKALFKEKGRAWQDAVLKVGKEYFGDKFSLKGKWRVPFKDTDTDDKIENEAMKGCILVRAKSGKRGDKPAIKPLIIGPRKNAEGKFVELTEQEIANIKGGDWGMLNVVVYPYDQSGGGVTFGLNAVQYWKADEGFGQGRAKLLESAEEMELDVDEASEEDVEGSDEESDDDSIV